MTKQFNLVDTIMSEIIKDDQDQQITTSKMITVYNNSNEKQREAISNFLIAFCGWTMPTLIKLAKKG